MGYAKFDIEKFIGKNDFGLWRVKMRALLVQQGIVEALQGPTALPTEILEKERNSILEKAHSAIILNLDDLENIDVKMEDEDKALLLLNSIPKSYEHFKDAMLYGRVQTISLDEVQSLIRAKELQKKHDMNEENSGDSLTVRGRSDRRDTRNNQNRSRSRKGKKNGNQSSKGPFKCYHWHKEGHFKKNSLAIIESEPSKEWILDSDNKVCKVVGSGTIRIRMFDGAERILQHVRKNGITRHKAVRSTPQQNRLAERMNRTLLERVRCMLLNAGLPKSFWGEAVSIACYLINRCPSTAIGMKTPLEMWYGKPINYNNLKVFRCLAYAHIKQDKLEARALSRDVVFDESKMANLQSYVTKNSVTKEGIPIEVELHQQQTMADQRTGVHDQDGENQQEPELETRLDNYNLVRDRQRRTIRPPDRYGHADLISYALNIAEEIEEAEPKNFKEALKSKDKHKWTKAMDEKIASLMKNKTWELVDRPKNQRVVGCKWIFKKKEGIPSVTKARYKAKLVAKGFTQVEGIDFSEIFSPVVKHCSIKLILALVAQYDLELEQLDVKTAFLYGVLEETIYMDQPDGYCTLETKDKVCLLKKSLYGLKQSPRQWYKRFDEFMLRIGFARSSYDSCVYMKKQDGEISTYLLLYVDDILVASKSKEEVQEIKDMLNSEFDRKDLGLATKILGMEIIRDRKKSRLFLSQKLSNSQAPESEDEKKYMESVPYVSGVGSIMYGMVCCRPDLAYAVSVISRFMANPGQAHWEALKWTLRYLRGSIDTRKSLTGFIFTVFGTAVSWKSNIQSVVALSTTEAEYIAVTEAIKEAMWLKGMVEELGIQQKVVTVFCDNQSTIHLKKNQVFHERSKHIDVKLHFVRDVIAKGSIIVKKIPTEENPVDMLIKALPVAKFRHCLDLVNSTEK
ncbi:hypothetical protein F3Y22_tig00110156pilonHSYRG00076 [Hibiscus syriacus]|uniref:Integrase catalytic domain-containing protein n=1 Tax=Hibiscus syriacus TaxID=106335 RepID=A0A6A3BFR2_HIBSY|nr:hypothetical protein F3Y22_tig00110156pilonHSYRG00076 [Hibiscus syriacus]